MKKIGGSVYEHRGVSYMKLSKDGKEIWAMSLFIVAILSKSK